MTLSPSSSTAATSDFSPNFGLHKIRRKGRSRLAFVFTSLVLFTFAYLHIRLSSPFANLRASSFAAAISGDGSSVSALWMPPFADHDPLNHAIVEPESNRTRHVSSIVIQRVELETVINQSPSVAGSDGLNRTDRGPGALVQAAASVLLPGWEVLVVVHQESRLTPDPALTDGFSCLFKNNITSPARVAGVLPSPYRPTFVCGFPPSLRSQRPYQQPLLTRSPSETSILRRTPELLLWKFMAYESFSTEADVVVFSKGLNNRQGINQHPETFNCIFFVGDYSAVNAVRTSVTHSSQEVFRCPHPVLTPSPSATTTNVRVSIEIARDKRVMPTTAYYKPRQITLAEDSPKLLACAASMVYNVAKVLKEWIVYHSKIGVKRFILYDNGSEDNLTSIVEDLNHEGYDVRTIYWPWAKSQEAGFSHAAVSSKQSCTWMLFLDVDEFLYAPPWLNRTSPSDQMIQSDLLPSISSPISPRIGQVSIRCYEFGPSGHRTHPADGVIHGYTCRRRHARRHKSMVLLEALHESLVNVIHHFTLKPGFRTHHWGLENGVINHYKYQAWPEFKTKFRRRVSAYVVDWTQTLNPMSKDRTPGLGFQAVEPEDWSERFCDVTDDRLKRLTWRWLGVESNTTKGGSGRVAWKRSLHDVSRAYVR